MPRVLTKPPPQPKPRYYSLKSNLKLWHYYNTICAFVKRSEKIFFAQHSTCFA